MCVYQKKQNNRNTTPRARSSYIFSRDLFHEHQSFASTTDESDLRRLPPRYLSLCFCYRGRDTFSRVAHVSRVFLIETVDVCMPAISCGEKITIYIYIYIYIYIHVSIRETREEISNARRSFFSDFFLFQRERLFHYTFR